MKAYLVLFGMILAGAPALSYGTLSIECGKGMNSEDWTFEETFLEVSTDEDFTGPAGENWIFILEGKELKGKKIAALEKKNAPNGDTSLIVTVAAGRDFAGIVGTQYKIKNIWNEETSLEVKALGGFAGGTTLGQYDCLVTED